MDPWQVTEDVPSTDLTSLDLHDVLPRLCGEGLPAAVAAGGMCEQGGVWRCVNRGGGGHRLMTPPGRRVKPPGREDERVSPTPCPALRTAGTRS